MTRKTTARNGTKSCRVHWHLCRWFLASRARDVRSCSPRADAALPMHSSRLCNQEPDNAILFPFYIASRSRAHVAFTPRQPHTHSIQTHSLTLPHSNMHHYRPFGAGQVNHVQHAEHLRPSFDGYEAGKIRRRGQVINSAKKYSQGAQITERTI